MITPKSFYHSLINSGIGFFSGVPDSLLKSFCAYLQDHCSDEEHLIAANEGSAIALGIGYHLATQRLPLIYMQNSGIGNAINPLLSLADAEVYSIPMLLLVGWRGEPGAKDEPQHMKQGRIMKDLLKTLEIPFDNVNPNLSSTQILNVLNALIEKSFKNKSPAVLLVSKGTFESYSLKSTNENSFKLLREEVIQLIAKSILDKDVIVSTTGLASRELFEFRASTNQNHSQDFLTVGGMGHANQIALGIAIQKKDRRVYCLDGDGALLMHMGSLVTNGSMKSQNFTHVLLNNSSHESVGGQPTPCNNIKIHKIAKEVGFAFCETVRTKEELITCIKKTQNIKGSVFIDVKLKNGFRANLGRPTKSPIQNKTELMQFLNQ